MSFFNERIKVSFEEMLMSFSEALNLVDDRLTDHHKQVAYICYEMGKQLKLDPTLHKELVMLALVHDLGAFKEQERTRMLSFEVENVMEHAVTGYLLLQKIGFYRPFAKAILYHHTFYLGGKNFEDVEPKIAMLSQLIFIADRISVAVISSQKNVLSSVGGIMTTIVEGSGYLFNPEYVDAMLELRRYDYFWLNLTTENKDTIIRSFLNTNEAFIGYEVFKEFTKMFVYSMDFRSRFTATHSAGVAAVARRIAELMNMSVYQCNMLEIAGYYHDIGKLMVPYEVLNKPGKLTLEEYNIIRQHPYYTYHILDKIKGMSYIREISAYHHEMIDGKGYPFRLEAKDLSEESKLLTIADIFTALTEQRPYRNAANSIEIQKLFKSLVKQGKIEGNISDTVVARCDELFELNHKVQNEVIEEFDQVVTDREALIKELEHATTA